MTEPKITENVFRSICPCPECGGTGKVQRYEVTNYHDYYEETWDELCPKCGGEGRVEKIETTYSLNAGVSSGYIGTINAPSEYVPLNGRRTEDIYKIGRRVN